MRLILASASPGRKLLLQQAGWDVLVRPSHTSELVAHPEGPVSLALANAHLKANATYKALPPTEQGVILAADTIVCLEHKVFGKPKDRAEAESMLTQLSGRWHKVITGVCLLGHPPNSVTEFSEITRVLFHPLELTEIRSYLDTIHPYDKAGAYAAQEGGEHIIDRVTGSFSNIVGLPLETLQNILKNIASEPPKASGKLPPRGAYELSS